MAGRSRRVRQARVKHAQSMTRLRNEVELQGAYISTYDSFSAYAAGTKTPGNLKLFRPEQRKQRGGYTAAQRKAYEPYMAMTWYRPEDIIDDKGGATSYRGTSNFNLDRFIRYKASSNKPTKGWFQSIANQYKGRALEAELGGLSRAKEALSGAKSFDPSSVGSSRGWRGGTSSVKAKNAAGFYIASGDGTTGVTGTVNNFANQSYKDAKAYGDARQAAETKEGKAAIDAKWQSDVQSSYLSSFGLTLKSKVGTDAKKPTETKKVDYGWSPSTYNYLGVLPEGRTHSDETKKLAAQQQAMLDANVGTGLVTFGLDGRVSAAPKSGKIDWSQFEGMTDQKKEQVKHDIRNIMAERDVASQISKQEAKEQELDEKIKNVESNIYFYNKVEESSPSSAESLSGVGGSNLFTEVVDATDKINKDSISSIYAYGESNPSQTLSGIYGNYASEGYAASEKYSNIRQSIPDDNPELKKAVDKRWQQKLAAGGSESGKPINWGKFLASEKLSGYEKELNKLNMEKKDLLIKGSTIGNAISSVGRNELFTKLYESGTFDDSLSSLMTVNTDQDRDRQINIMKSMAQDQQGIEASISTLSKIERKLISFNHRHRTSHKTIKDKKREELYDEIRKKIPGLNIDTDMSITDVKKTVGKISKDYSNEFKNIKNQKNELALKIAKNSTSTQRLELAEGTNKTAKFKQDIEEMIGYSLSGETPSDIKSQWDQTFVGQYVYGQQDMSSGETVSPINLTDEQKKNEAMRTWKSMGIGSESGWNQNWIGGGGKNLMRGAESINLLTGGKIDQTKLTKFASDAKIVKKYDSWDQAAQYIGGSITEYKDDIKKTYKKSHKVGSVSDATIAKSWFGKSTVEGESWTLNVANNLGVREGLYAGQDIGKIVKTSEKYSSTIKNEIDLKKKELIVLREKRRLLQESHKALAPLIDDQVQKDYDAGGKNLNQVLVKKLSASSESLYDLNYEIAEHQVAQKYYEKSLIKTDRDIEKYKKIKKQVDFQTVQGITSGGMINRITRSGSYGRNQANKFRRNTGARRRTVRGGVNKRQRRGLGGLVT